MPKPKKAYLLGIGHVGCLFDFRQPGTNKNDLIDEAYNILEGDIELKYLHGMREALRDFGIFYPTMHNSTRVVELIPMSETDIDDWWNEARDEWEEDH